MLGVVAAALSLVPRFGLALGAVPVVLLSAGIGGAGRALWAIVAVVALQVADAFVTARLIEPRTVRVGPAVSLGVVLLATNLYGIGGAAVALVVVAVAMAVLEQLLPELPTEPDDRPPAPFPDGRPGTASSVAEASLRTAIRGRPAFRNAGYHARRPGGSSQGRNTR